LYGCILHASVRVAIMSVRGELVRLGVRLLLKRPERGASVERIRARRRSLALVTPRPPFDTTTTCIDAGGVRAHRIVTPESRRDRHILFLHGGGYVAGSPSNYRHVTWRFASAARAVVIAPDYRLAPEHPFPAALDDALSAYRWLLASGEDPRRIALLGDSAGGGLVFALLLKLQADDVVPPAAVVALSPWTDLAQTGASLHLNARADPMINAESAWDFAACYLAGADPHTPYASPLYGDWRRAPPTLIHAGSDEVLRDDAVRMANRLRAAGCEVVLEIWPRMPHVWHAFAPILPEARRAIERIGEFLQDRL
jgi:acetyl esterase/lipase